MMRRYNRLLVAFYIISDAVLAMAGFMIAYWLRFYSGLPVPKGIPPFNEYLSLLPIMGAIVPAAFHIQGIYRLRRGRSRVDDFFAVFVGTVLAVVLGVGGTLYFRTYWLPDGAVRQGWLEALKLTGEPELPLQLLIDPNGMLRCRVQGAVEAEDLATLRRIIAG